MFFWCLFSLISSVEKNKGWSWAEASISVVKSLPLIISSEFLAWIFYTFWILFQVSYLYSLRTVCWRLEAAYKMNNVWCNGRIYMCIYVYLYVCVCACVFEEILLTHQIMTYVPLLYCVYLVLSIDLGTRILVWMGWVHLTGWGASHSRSDYLKAHVRSAAINVLGAILLEITQRVKATLS